MHSGQIGFPQMAHFPVTVTVRCFGQNFPVGIVAGDGGSGVFASCEIFRRGAGGGSEARDGAGASGNGSRAACSASSSRIIWLTYSDESSPQFGQTNRAGFRAISGVTSKLYFVPQEHWIFMALGLGI
jgi:hypothetical protein